MRIGLDGEVEFGIADSYDLSEDYLTYTFHLRPAQWSNGDEVTAYDFEYTWKKIIDPKSGFNLGVPNFYCIKNAREAFQGEKPLDSVGIKALDDKTLQVELCHPTPYFLEVVSTTYYLPVNAHIDQQIPNWPTLNGNQFICNGPFILDYRKIENEAVVTKNPNYWDPSLPHLSKIRVSIIKDLSTQLNLFEKNQIHWLGRPFAKISLDAIDHLRKAGKIHFSKTLDVYWFFLNTESFPFHNKKMRKAFAYAINRQAIIDHILKGEETPACSILPYQLATQDTPFFKDNDQERALQLFNEALDELGITKDQLPEITLNYNTSIVYLRIGEAVQQQWKRAFGVNIRLEQQDMKFHFEKLQKGNFQIGGVQWHSWLRDPIYNMQTFLENRDGINMSRWVSQEYIDLVRLADMEMNPEKRKKLFNQAEAILMEEMPIIPIFFATYPYAKNDKLKDVNIKNYGDLRWARIEE